MNNITDKEPNGTPLTDKQFAELLRDSVPHAPADPWFTRKVINRLDPRRRRIAAIIERLIYIIGIATTSAVAIRMGKDMMSTSVISIQQAVTILILSGLTAAMIYALIEPVVSSRHLRK